MGRDGHVMRKLSQELQLLHCQLIDLVEHVNAGNVRPVTLHYVDEVIGGSVALQYHVCIHDTVLGKDSFHRVKVHLRAWYSRLKVDASAILPPQHDVGRLLVQPNAEPFQLILDFLLLVEWAKGIEHDDNERAGLRHGDNLPTSTLTIFCTFNDTWKIEELNFGTAIPDNTGYASEGGELVRCSLRKSTGQLGEEGGLSDRREPDKTHAGITSRLHIKAFSLSSTTASSGLN
mmetsp:Transcript_7865/g.20466  ORF Transcript_7865/g.20466 Transcript_7865/m.20466 type:complete len:232 (-) Transcript_7865:276-971(-)